MDELRALLDSYIEADRRLYIWRTYPFITEVDDAYTDSWACEEVSAEFAAFARKAGWDAAIIHGEDPEAPFAFDHAWVRLSRDGHTSAASALLGDDHVGPEHLLAGLARATESDSGRILSDLGITAAKVHAAIKDTTAAPAPTRPRTFEVFLPSGPSLFKSGGTAHPDLATAQAARPGKEIAPFTVPLRDGEFFDVSTVLPKGRFKPFGSYADYPAAYAAAEQFKETHTGYEVVIRIVVPDVQEIRGKDHRGHDVVLGRSVEYHRIRLVHRIFELTAAAKAS